MLTEFVNISARFIANKAAYKFKNERICEMKQKLRAMLEEKALSKGADK